MIVLLIYINHIKTWQQSPVHLWPISDQTKPSTSAHTSAHPGGDEIELTEIVDEDIRICDYKNGEEAPAAGLNANIKIKENCAKACFSHFDKKNGQHGFIYGSISVLGGNKYCYS